MGRQRADLVSADSLPPVDQEQVITEEKIINEGMRTLPVISPATRLVVTDGQQSTRHGRRMRRFFTI